MFEQITNYFIPAEYKSNDSLSQARVVVNASLLTGLFAVYYMIHSHLTDYHAGYYSMIIHSVSYFSNPFLFKKKVYGLKTAGWVYMFTIYGAVVSSTIFSGGFHSMVTPWLCIFPIFGALIVNIRAGAFFTFISVLTIYLIWQFSIGGDTNYFPNQIAEEYMPFWYLSSIVGYCTISFAVAYVFHDAKIKTIRKVEEQKDLIENQKGKLEYSNQTKDRIFAILGHDLRKPAISFRGITKKVKFLLKKERYQELDKLGEDIEENAIRLNTMIDNILHWAMTQRGLSGEGKKIINLSAVINEVMDFLSSLVEQKNLSIVNNIETEYMLYADRNAVSTIIRNLLDNSIKYTKSFGIIQIDASEEANFIKIEIKDNGRGISKGKMDKLFKLYRSKSEKGTEGEKGTGLGLHLISELIKQNNGKIEVESVTEVGTTFSVFLPKERYED